MKISVLATEWWNELSKEKQQQYLSQHPHSHQHQTKQVENEEPLSVQDSPEIEHIFNYIDQGHDLGISHYLNRQLNSEEKAHLAEVVAGKREYSATRHTLKKVLTVAITAAIIGAGVIASPALILSIWAALKLRHHNPEKWLYHAIYGIGGDSFKAVEDTFQKQKLDMNRLNDHHLNRHLDNMED